MTHAYVRVTLFVGLAAFIPLFYYLAVVGGLLPYGAILLIAIRNLTDSSMLWFSAIHLAVYGLLLYWFAGLITRVLIRVAGSHLWPVVAGVLLIFALVGLLPIFGVAHGQIHWTNAYALYRSDALR